MIKFKGKYENKNIGTIQSYIDNFPAIASNNIAEQLNKRKIKKDCPVHPNFESEILVVGEPIGFEVGTVCCEDFRKELERFLKEQ